MKISIAIPTWEYNGFGVECLEYSFMQMKEQLFEDFVVVISDQSIDNKIKDLCTRWNKKLHIKYVHNPETGNAAQNMNNAVANCDTEWIKILCQDDYLAYSNSMLKISGLIDNIEKNEEEKFNWLATGYLHTHDRRSFERYHQPFMNDNIGLVNTIGTPSCVAFRNIKPMLEFDTNLSYYYDCEYYYRFWKQYGNPLLNTDVTIVNYLWDKAYTSKVDGELIDREENYIKGKHDL